MRSPIRTPILFHNALEAAVATITSPSLKMLGGVNTIDHYLGGKDWVNATVPVLSETPNNQATVTLAVGADQSDYLVANTFGFNIPASKTIDGILFQVKCSASVTGVLSDRANIQKAGSYAADASYYSTAVYPGYPTFGIVNYGGPTEMFGNTWTPAEINDAGFGIQLWTEKAGGASSILYIDVIQCSVYFH